MATETVEKVLKTDEWQGNDDTLMATDELQLASGKTAFHYRRASSDSLAPGTEVEVDRSHKSGAKAKPVQHSGNGASAPKDDKTRESIERQQCADFAIGLLSAAVAADNFDQSRFAQDFDFVFDKIYEKVQTTTAPSE